MTSLAAIALTIGCLAVVEFACAPRPTERSAGAAARTGGASALADARERVPVESSAPAFERLRGRWVRTDGGYLLDVRAVSAQGEVELVYLNPRPIHVHEAVAQRAGRILTLFVELRDENYPGSRYNLAYDPERDLLAGTYFQAVAGETYAVAFERR